MVAPRRLRPLGIALLAGVGVVVARVYQVQVLQHETWAAQAASFVHDARVVPYHRGRVLDRDGRELVRDEDVARVELVYRDFRRGHPLGRVAHAWTALTGRPVGAAEVAPELAALARELVRLTPDALAAFGRGAPLAGTGGRALAAAAAPHEIADRAQRARDLAYYVRELLGVAKVEHTRIARRIADGQGARPWIELVAAERGARAADPRANSPAELDAQRISELVREFDRTLARDLERALADFDDLARALASAAGEEARGREPRAWLLELLDERRAELEDAAADELFAAATGFEPGRIPTEALAHGIDLAWIARDLAWDAPRLARWSASRRAAWERALEKSWLPRILLAADVESEEPARAARVLDGLAALYRSEAGRAGSLDLGELRPWHEITDACVLSELDDLFESRAVEPDGATLAFHDEARVARARQAGRADPWLALGFLLEPAAPDACAMRWQALSISRAGLDGDAALAEALAAVRSQESRLAAAVLAALESARAGGGPLALSEARLERAAEHERYMLVDVQSRALRLALDPPYELVHLLARDPERLAGFRVRETTRRVQLLLDAHGEACAGLLVGRVRRPLLRELTAQSRDERRLEELQRTLFKSADEERELADLAARLARPDEWIGDQGLEAWFDGELRGRYGVVETTGLARSDEGDEARLLPAVDGADLALTLDAELQIAAQDVLARPDPPAGETDRVWFENPVGAIVLLTADGDVLAAASAPARSGLPVVVGRGPERGVARERTLQRPGFNPPGSVFKPFVSAWALDRLGFDPSTVYECKPRAKDGLPGFESLKCNGLHGSADMHRALAVSCNAWFGQFGLAFEPEQLVAAAREFGFGESCGVRGSDTAGRRGWREDWRLSALPDDAAVIARVAVRFDRLRFPNGLGLLEASPMQVARATAGLATGILPELRVVRAVGGAEIPRRSRPLALSAASLEYVRAAMRAVVEEPQGSAHGKGLSEGDLGFRLACKTGSADLGPIRELPGMPPDDLADLRAGKARKHTWLAGWFPAEEPRAIVVVYLHEVTETASRTAVHVAAQFLKSEAVRRYARGEGGT